MAIFTTEGKSFIYNGKPLQIISGSIHYFRVVPDYWKDRLQKLKACGFNTVETYIAWNIHEPKEGEFSFTGMADIVRFIELAADEGLHVIIRPSPYICAEWEFGGLPSWLLNEPDIRLRCFNKPFLDKIDAYYDVLLPLLRPLLCTNGGPIIAMQVENEYGSYGNDKEYLEYIRQGMVNRGIDVLLFTSDGPEDHMLQGGSIEGVLATVNFGSRPEEAFEKLLEYQPDQPLMCMEYWNGWFDHWGEEHHVREFDDVADVLDRILRSGASVNFYMFLGGTNFGFYNGANYFNTYEPTVTSYDYHALLSESGDITDKYIAMKEVISKYTDIPDIEIAPSPPKQGYGRIEMTDQSELLHSLDQLSVPVQRTNPETMEQLGQDYGFILYSTQITGPRPVSKLILQDVHDRALIFLNGVYQGVISRNSHDRKLEIEASDICFAIPKEGATLNIFVENMGRVNYGWMLNDPKGITEGVRFERQFLFDWTIHSLPLNDLTNLSFTKTDPNHVVPCGPIFYRTQFQVDALGDTYINMDGWSKGVVYINGFNIGRYWEVGPQKTLYIPAALLHIGSNEIIIFELHHTKDASVTLQDYPILG